MYDYTWEDPDDYWMTHWVCGDIERASVSLPVVQTFELERLSVADTISIKDITSLIWTQGANTSSIAVGLNLPLGKNAEPLPGPSVFQMNPVFGTTHGEPLPGWSPTIVCSWDYGTGLMSGTSEFTGWSGSVTIPVEGAIGQYTLTTRWDLYDTLGAELYTETVTTKVYETFSYNAAWWQQNTTLGTVPPEALLAKATDWASGAQDADDALRKLASAIHGRSGWKYYLPDPGATGGQILGWGLAKGVGSEGDCQAFSWAWTYLANALGIGGVKVPEPFYGANNLGFLTKTGLTSPDGKTGNAHPSDHTEASADRWVFRMHQVGARTDVNGTTTYYDPTFGTWGSAIDAAIDYSVSAGTGVGEAAVQAGPYSIKLERRANKDAAPHADPVGMSSYEQTRPLPTTRGSVTSMPATHTADANEDGLFEALFADFALEFDDPGDYFLIGYLEKDGAIISSRSSSTDTFGFAFQHFTVTEVGTFSGTLSFSGEDIYDAEESGPFTVVAVVADADGNVLDSQQFQTPAYDYSTFGESPRPLVWTGDYSATPIDTDGNHVPNIFRITAGLDVQQVGEVAFQARLVDKNGRQIYSVYGVATVTQAGFVVVNLDFDAAAIYQHGVDGPYYLQDLSAYLVPDSTNTALLRDGYATQAYYYQEFGLLLGDANEDGRVSFADYLVLEANFGTQSGAIWSMGDFNHDGKVSFADYLALEANFGRQI